jgi:hypothetical protein
MPDAAPPPGDGAPSDAPPSDGNPDGGNPTEGEGTPGPQPGDTPPPDAVPGPGSPDGTPPGETPQPGDPTNPDGGQPDNENPDGTPRRPPPPRTLREQALAAFRSGNDAMAFKLLQAHYAVVPAAKQELAEKMAWIPGLMRPALAPRIGIAVHEVDVPANFKGNPMPIGSSELTSAVDQWQQAEASDRRIGGTGRPSKLFGGDRGIDFSEGSKGGDAMQNAPAMTQLTYYLGDFGEWFLEALHERMETGEYGAVMKELAQQGRPARPARGLNGQPGETYPGGFPDGGAGGFPPPGEPGGFPGPGGGRFGEPPPAGGQFGGTVEGIPGAEPASATPPRRWSTRGGDKERANLVPVKQLIPCTIWLGKDTERDVINKRAEAAGVDVLAVFEMTLREARSGSFVNNKTMLRLVNLRMNKPLPGYSPEPLINLTVEQWRQKNEKGVDPAEREVTKAVEALDKALMPVPLPDTVTAERAKKRIEGLVAARPADPLPVIVEARYYFAKGLLSEQDFTDAAKTLLGEEGFIKLSARAKEGQ